MSKLLRHGRAAAEKTSLSKPPLLLAFCLFVYRPHGGLQRGFMQIASLCRKHGHQIRVYCMHWDGPTHPEFDVHIVRLRQRSNHARSHHFALEVQQHLNEQPVDAVIGFNRMPGLDLYYASDPCFVTAKANKRGKWYRLTPRYKRYAASEKAVFDKSSNTHVLIFAEREIEKFKKHYNTPEYRIHRLPPGIDKNRRRPDEPIAQARRAELRSHLGLSCDIKMLLLVGSGFETKGVDRALVALSSLPKYLNTTHLYIVGVGHTEKFQAIAKRLGVDQRSHFLGGRDDVPDFLLAADLLVHPARTENTGNVLLEATIAGLPVLTSDVCGYADYIREAGSGRVMPADFTQFDFNEVLADTLESDQLQLWSRNGVRFGQQEDLYGRASTVAALIEAFTAGELNA